MPKAPSCPDNYIFGLHCHNSGLWKTLFLKKKKKKKENQSQLWLDRSAVKPSHVENRAATALQDQKTEWAHFIIRQNYLTGLEKKEKKKDEINTPTLTPQMSDTKPRDLGFWCGISAYYPLLTLLAYFFSNIWLPSGFSLVFQEEEAKSMHKARKSNLVDFPSQSYSMHKALEGVILPSVGGGLLPVRA